MNSPPYSSSELSLSPNYSPPGVPPHMDSHLTSTWHVLDQPPPPSLREILAAYKSRGDGDREMLLAMLNAKSAEDQRLASMASLRRTVLEISQTTEPPLPPHVPQYQPSSHFSPHPAHNQYGHSSASYTPPPVPSQQIAHSPPLAYAHALGSPSASSPKTALPSARARPFGSGSGAGPSESQTRQKRARRLRSPRSLAHVHLHTISPETEPQRDLPPSPYSSSRDRSMSSEGSPQPAQHGAMTIGSLLSGDGAGKVKRERDRDDTWSFSQRERRASRDGPSHSSDAP
ncbi:hypothetical protein DFH11DRAFT_75137 [Phellopilus nigrolimitatus]|nr:hypothetical protein DFH11DRAFT_75137 [Phellopilus nigrolimitatus]